MRPEGLMRTDAGLFSKQDFQVAETILTEILSRVSSTR
jgi:hypothetical protein